MISVICPIYNEEKYIARCVESILEQDYPQDDMEVLFMDGMSTDRTRDILARYVAQYPFIRVEDNPERIVPYAMNRGIEVSRGDVIIRLDAHAFYPKNYFSTLVRSLNELHADNVGAVCKTDVLNHTVKALAIREVLSHRLGVGNSAFRVGISKVMSVDTVPFGCFRRDVFDRYGLYDVRLVRNQDIELNKRISNHGGKIYIVPDTYCVYYARETYAGLAKNNYQNGKWNIQTVYYTKSWRSLSVRHFVPGIFVLAIVLPMLIGLFWMLMLYVALLVVVLYMLAIGCVALRCAVSKRLSVIHLCCAFVVLHVSYGIGELSGAETVLRHIVFGSER